MPFFPIFSFLVSSSLEMLVKNRWFWGAIIESFRRDDSLLLRVAPRGVGVAIELMLVREGNRHHEPRYGSFSVCVEGTAPAGG